MGNAEAVEKLARLVTLHRKHSSSTKIANAIIAAIRANLFTYFPPKPLEWVDNKWNTKEYFFGHYGIGQHNDGKKDVYNVRYHTKGMILWVQDDNYERLEFSTPEAAQAAAETHRNEMLAKEFV